MSHAIGMDSSIAGRMVSFQVGNSHISHLANRYIVQLPCYVDLLYRPIGSCSFLVAIATFQHSNQTSHHLQFSSFDILGK